MGFSTIGASVILFIGILFVSSTVLEAGFDGQRSVLDATQDERERDRLQREAAATVRDGAHSGTTLHLNVTNTGSVPLDASKVGIVIDGTWSAPAIQGYTVDGKTTTVWAPGETLWLRVGAATQPERAFVILETGRGALWTAED